MSRYNDRNRGRDRSPSPRRGEYGSEQDSKSRDTRSKQVTRSISPVRGNGNYRDDIGRRERSTSRDSGAWDKAGRERTRSRNKRTSPRGERDMSPLRDRRDRTPSIERQDRSSSYNSRRNRDRTPPRNERNRNPSPEPGRDNDGSRYRNTRDRNSSPTDIRNRDRASPRFGRDKRRGRSASPKTREDRVISREGRSRSPLEGIRTRNSGRERDRTPTDSRDRSSSANSRNDRNRSVTRGERSRDRTPSRGRNPDRSPSRRRRHSRDNTPSIKRERKRSYSNNRTSDRSRSLSAGRGSRATVVKFEDLTSSQLSKWLKEIGVSSNQIEDMERKRVSARELQKMSEREIAKIIGDKRTASTILREVDHPSKDILEAVTGGKRELRDEDYIGKTVKVDDRGRTEDARVVEIIDRKYWKVKILDTGKLVEVRKSDIELPRIEAESRNNIVGLTVTVKSRRGEREGTIERDNKDGTYEVEYRDGRYDRSVPKEDINFPKEGKGGAMYDIELDELEGVKLDVGGGYMGGNPEVRIFCGSQRKEVHGRGSDPKFNKVKFSDVDGGMVRDVIFELHSRGMMRTSKVAEAKLPLKDLLDESRGISEQVTFYTSKDEKKGKLHFRISCKSSKSKTGGGKHDDNIEIGVSRKGIIPRSVYRINGTNLVISEGDLVNYSGDAIINCCDPECLGKSGLKLDRALNSEGGRVFEDDREDLKKDRHGDRCPIGTAVIMSGGKLRAEKVIHAAAPKFSSRSSKRDLKELQSLWKDCITKSNDENCRDVAFYLLPPVDWHGGLELEDVVESTLDSLKYELEKGSSLEEVHLVANSKSELRVFESEAEYFLSDFRSKESNNRSTQLDVKTSDGKIYQEDFEDMMAKLELSRKEANILFEYHDKEGEGYLIHEDFLSCYPIFKEQPDDLRRIGDRLKDKTDEIIQGYKKFVNKQVEAKWKERERGLEGWLPATIIRVNNDGTFEVEYDEKDRSGRRLLWEDCPRRKIKLPAEERSKIVVAVKQGSGFPRGSWMSRSKPRYSVCIFGDKETTELARTKPQSGSSPNFDEKLTFTCAKGKYRDLRFEVQDDSKYVIMDGFLRLDDDRSRDSGRPRKETVKLKSRKSSGESGNVEVTVVCSLAFSVRQAFGLMSDRNGEVTFRSFQRFISDNNLAVKEDQIKDVFDAIDKRDSNIITLKEFTALNPSQTGDSKDFVDALLNFEQGAGGGAGREEVKRWSERDVEDWLEKKGWSKYISAFKRIDGFRLLGLTAVDLEDMRIDRRDTYDILSDVEELSGGGAKSDPRDWTEKDVAAWVTKQGFKRDAQSFEDERIDGRALLKIDQRTLVDSLRMDWRDAKDLMIKLDELTREGDRRSDNRDRSDDRKEPDRQRGDDDRRKERETSGGDRDNDRTRENRREPARPFPVVFQFGEKNVNSTRDMEVNSSETPQDICEKIHEKFLKNVNAKDMELLFKQKPLHPTNLTMGEIGAKKGDRIVIRRRK